MTETPIAIFRLKAFIAIFAIIADFLCNMYQLWVLSINIYFAIQIIIYKAYYSLLRTSSEELKPDLARNKKNSVPCKQYTKLNLSDQVRARLVKLTI